MTNLTPTTKIAGINITCTPELSEPGAVFAARSYFKERGFNRASVANLKELSNESGIGLGWNQRTRTPTLGVL